VALCAWAGAEAAPVRTSAGLVEGTVENGIAVYKGVPFAAPPVDDLRWRAPRPPKPWTGVKQATAYAPGCMQTPITNPLLGIPPIPLSEDCLYLNVWTPAKSAGERLPVMVWIYGGGFTAGATSYPTYDGASLARRGVVLVSVAYRLGPFGFLAHPELSRESGHGSGTYGLMDQIAGLQWVKQNIAAFGGDPNRVTIFGESAGGIAVSMLAASPRAKGLFHGVISESGGSFAPPRHDGEGSQNVPTLAMAEKTGADFLAKAGAPSIAEGRKLSAEALVKAAGPALGAFWPVLDGYVITGDQYRLYEQGRYNDVPVLAGSNADEGALFVPRIAADAYQAQIKGGYGAYADKLLAAYPGTTDAEALRSDRDVFRDGAFAWGTWTWARLQSKTGRSKAFVYYFNHRPPYPDVPATRDWGASHAGELAFVFGNWGRDTPSPANRAMSETIQAYWVNFARTGDPNGSGLPAWPAYAGEAGQVMHFDAQAAQAGPTPNLDKLKVWDGYFAWRRSQAPGP
jgi:para-nitrobenzyl esterase